MGARRDGDLPAGRDPSGLRRRLLRSRSCARSRTRCPSCTCTRSARSRSGRARRRSAFRCATTSSGCATRGSRRCRARRPRCSTTRCARSSARTRSRPRSGSRCTRPRTRSACARTTRSCSATSTARGSWARHLVAVRDAARRTGGFTEFVPLPFVHMEAPIYLRGRARPGPTWGETLLMHAVGRLALHPWIKNVQVSWVKAGPQGAVEALNAGVNDLGGTLMNESISRAAGAEWGQELRARADGGADPLGRPRAAAADDALRRRAGRSRSRARSAPRRSPSREPARERGAARAAARARPARLTGAPTGCRASSGSRTDRSSRSSRRIGRPVAHEGMVVRS